MKIFQFKSRLSITLSKVIPLFALPLLISMHSNICYALDSGAGGDLLQQSIDGLHSQNAAIQRQALLLLGTMEKEADKAVPEIGKVLLSGADDTAAYALKALNKIGTTSALTEVERYAEQNLKRLIGILTDSTSAPELEATASKILGELGGYALDAVPFLIDYSIGADEATQKYAMTAAKQILSSAGVNTTFGYSRDMKRFYESNQRALQEQFKGLRRSLR